MRKPHTSCLLIALAIFLAAPLAHATCVTSVLRGICGPYNYPQVTGNNGKNVDVENDFWNAAKAPAHSAQTLYASGPGDWYAIAQFPTGNTAVESYPDSDARYKQTPRVSSYNYLYSSYAGKMNPNANTSAEAAYDIWMNGHANEVMIWTDRVNRSLEGCHPLATRIAFGGSHGVSKHLWDLCSYGHEIVWSLDQPSLGTGTPTIYGIPSGSVDIYHMLMWLEQHGYLKKSTTLTQLEYGFEVSSTGGVKERFQLTGWSVTASHP